LILFRNDEELESVSNAVHRLVHRAIALDGTCRYLVYSHYLPKLMKTCRHWRARSRYREEGVSG
jgi:hypothetical protein